MDGRLCGLCREEVCGDAAAGPARGASPLRQAVTKAISQIDSVAVGREAGYFAHEQAEDAELAAVVCGLAEGRPVNAQVLEAKNEVPLLPGLDSAREEP